MKKFAIGIPTLNRFDILYPALLFYVRDYPETKIYVVDNGNQDIKSKFADNDNVIVIQNEKNMGVSRSWNQLCDLVFQEHDYVVMLNDDIYFGRKDWEVNNLLTNFDKDFYLTQQQWCVYILPKKTWEAVGRFDETFYPAYYEDNDYEYRMKLLGMEMFKIPFLNPFLYQQSKTIEKMPELKQHAISNRERYIEKWGGEPNKETYKTPYNK